MNEELGTDEQKTLEKLYESVAYRIVHGESKGSIVSDLMAQGWDSESALELINNVEETVEEYVQPPKEWKQTKTRRYIAPILIGAVCLAAGITFFVIGIISPEYKYILPIGLLVFGAINFFWGFGMWSKYRK